MGYGFGTTELQKQNLNCATKRTENKDTNGGPTLTVSPAYCAWLAARANCESTGQDTCDVISYFQKAGCSPCVPQQGLGANKKRRQKTNCQVGPVALLQVGTTRAEELVGTFYVAVGLRGNSSQEQKAFTSQLRLRRSTYTRVSIPRWLCVYRKCIRTAIV